MTVSKIITYPQKFAPAGFALYWLARSEYLDFFFVRSRAF